MTVIHRNVNNFVSTWLRRTCNVLLYIRWCKHLSSGKKSALPQVRVELTTPGLWGQARYHEAILDLNVFYRW